jgi:hypothetical protein
MKKIKKQKHTFINVGVVITAKNLTCVGSLNVKAATYAPMYKVS